VRVANRTLERAQALAAEFGPAVQPVRWQERADALAGAGLLVNATSMGMTGEPPLDIALDALPAGALVNDIVYVPLETDLLARVFDSDAAVHALYAPGGDAVEPLRALAPEAVVDGGVDRRRLAALVQADPALLKKIEAAVHPLVKARQRAFLAAAAKTAQLAVLDIPLLFETGREADVDVVIVVSANERLQRQRALQRPGMTEEKLDFILSRQLPDAEKRARADYVIDTSESLAATAREVDAVIAAIIAKGKASDGT